MLKLLPIYSVLHPLSMHYTYLASVYNDYVICLLTIQSTHFLCSKVVNHFKTLTHQGLITGQDSITENLCLCLGKMWISLSVIVLICWIFCLQGKTHPFINKFQEAFNSSYIVLLAAHITAFCGTSETCFTVLTLTALVNLLLSISFEKSSYRKVAIKELYKLYWFILLKSFNMQSIEITEE